MSASGPSGSSSGQSGTFNVRNAARVIVVGSVMFSFISYWRTAAVVLCDLGSTAYYIGGIVEQAIGAAAPWFILAVMVFSYAVRSVYIESCSLFIRGGVYRVVREALGRFFAKLAVSALIFDYLLTGPISGVSAGHYLVGLFLDSLRILDKSFVLEPATREVVKNWGAVLCAVAVTIYFFRLNVRGIHESSDRALKIMVATTIMVVVILAWCGITLAVNGIAKNEKGETNALPMLPKFEKPAPKPEAPSLLPVGDPALGWLSDTSVGDELRSENINWFSLIGAIGILIAFGHSILAMSGEETLAQVYREVESPKLKNFRKAALIVFVYSLVFTAGISFLAVMLIPENLRRTEYSENLISGLAMNVLGPEELRLALNAFVVIVGFLILAGAVNTAIIGSNGVLNRVAEDGVMPDWFLKPHRKFGTTYRILYLIVGLQLLIIVVSHGDVLLLGEAYAFGVVWSFVFQALAMVVLRFKDTRPREYKVPFNVRLGKYEIPFGLLFVLVVLFAAAVLNLFTKQLATIFGLIFTAAFFAIFFFSELYHDRKLKGKKHKHLEQFNQQSAERVDPAALGLEKPYHKLVAIRSTQNLVMLDKALADTDPATTDVIVMTAKSAAGEGSGYEWDGELDPYDQDLMTAVVQRAEKIGKHVKPLIVPTNNPLYALLRTAKELDVQELVLGASNKYSADEQMEQISLYWINLSGGEAAPLTIRVIGRNLDVHFDLGGGNRIPKIGERRARSVAELRATGVGFDRVLLVAHDNADSVDLFEGVLTMLDPEVPLGVVLAGAGTNGANGNAELSRLVGDRSKQIARPVQLLPLGAEPGPDVVRLAKDGDYDLIILAPPEEATGPGPVPLAGWMEHVLRNAHCRVLVASTVALPQQAVAE